VQCAWLDTHHDHTALRVAHLSLFQIVEEKAHSERALLLTVKELEARLAGLDSEKEAVISRSIVNLRHDANPGWRRMRMHLHLL
jgi:hypothetical protein